MLISSVRPLMVKTADNPGGTPIETFDDFRAQLAANRVQFYLDVSSGPSKRRRFLRRRVCSSQFW
jgi:non-heme chloroperoxidase